jgi:hypothetical protein
LRIASDLELPELHSGSGAADVRIRYHPSAAPSLAAPDEWLQVTPGRVSLRLEDIQFTIENGQSILIETSPHTSPQDIRVWLLGSVMAALLHQRGYLPLHANVVALADGISAAAFAGNSGAGKSTLAAWFDSHGHRVLTDDLCAIHLGTNGRPTVFEGIPRVKLWSDTLDMLGRATERFEKVASDLDKFHVPTSYSGDRGSPEPLSLERIYLLGGRGPTLEITPVSGATAAQGILANAFRWELGQKIRPARAQFDQCLAVARHARVFRIERRWGFDRFNQDCAGIERHLRTPLEELAGA